MKDYESPNAELLKLDDVITSSGAVEPCDCYALDKPGEMCKACPQQAIYSSQPGV